MNVFNSSLIRKFAVYSLLASALTGIGLSVIISKHISTYAIDAKIDMVEFALSNEAMMASAEDEHPSATEIPSDIDTLLHLVSHLNSIGVLDYMIWNESGELISHMHPEEHNPKALPPSPQTHQDDSKLPSTYEIVKSDSTASKKLLKINTFHESAATHQKYIITAIFPYDGIVDHQNLLIKNIIIALSAGLVLLYILLIRVLENASKTLVSQKDNLDFTNQELKEAYEHLNISFHASVQALAFTVDARDQYTAGHVNRVMDYSKSIGGLLGLCHDEIELLMLAAQFHDIGKIGVPDTVLLKPGRLTDDEYAMIKTHPDIGVSILRNIPDFASILPAVRHHHERYDGGGYPTGLSGNDIPLEARIIAVADAYDAMTTNRPYRHALSIQAAIEELVRNRCTQFDPQITDAFIQILTTEFDSDSAS